MRRFDGGFTSSDQDLCFSALILAAKCIFFYLSSATVTPNCACKSTKSCCN